MKFFPIEEKGQIWIKKNIQKWKIKAKDILKYTTCTTLYLLHENVIKKGLIHACRWWELIFQQALMLRILMIVWKKTYWKFIIHISYLE